ncbi:MAG: hypothetical protein Q8M16_16320 [Pirellulaceae bacterium]|nr:hypothetical protein [Pirellulaceae bacterium]
MPITSPSQKHFVPSAATTSLDVNRVVLAQMLACGIMGWSIFAFSIDRLLPRQDLPELPRSESVVQHVSSPINGSVSVKSAQFNVNDRDQTR